MLSGHGRVMIATNTITKLYYADDIALLASNKHNLHDMLRVAYRFANTLGLKYNNKKSNILLTGQRCSDKQWVFNTNNHIGFVTHYYSF